MAQPASSRQRGFTVLELIVVAAFLALAATIFVVQKRNLQVSQRDATRKTAINAIYYNLENIYYPAHHSYPQTLTTDDVKGMDPSLLKDPNGKMINAQGSDYRYTPRECTDGACQGYTLTAHLQAEADYSRDSQQH